MIVSERVLILKETELFGKGIRMLALLAEALTERSAGSGVCFS